MKKHVLVGFLLSASCAVWAQNKTLGVGTSTPNPNAALHVESPTNNQGLILPRLTTAQRTAGTFVSALGAADNGLIVYDTDLQSIFIWDGTAWKDTDAIDVTSTSLSNGATFSVNNASNQSAAIYATTNGTAGAQAYQSAAILGETATAFSAVTGHVASGPSNGISGISASSDPGSFAVLGQNSGAGPAGMFFVTNASNASNAFEATTMGTGGAGRFQVNNVNSVMPALWAETNSNQPLSAPIFGLNTGTGDVAASFKINNAASTFPSLYVETNGTGRGATIKKTNAAGGQPGLFVSTEGGNGIWADHNGATGNAGIIQNINASNPHAALFTEAVGTGPSIWTQKSTATSTGLVILAEHFGPSGGVANFTSNHASNPTSTLHSLAAGVAPAGHFEITNASSNAPALLSATSGTGSAIQGLTSTGFTAVYGRREGATNGNAGLFEIVDGGNAYPAVHGMTIGGGSAGNFNINNSGSTSPALYAQTNGQGPAIAADNTSIGDVITATKTGASGSAANFQTNNASNNASAIFGMTNAPLGFALGVNNTANGNSMAIFGGGMKVSTLSTSTTTISTRAVAYLITGAGSYTFSLSPAPTDGEIFYMFNSTGGSITVEGTTIGAGTGKTFIYMFGAFRAF